MEARYEKASPVCARRAHSAGGAACTAGAAATPTQGDWALEDTWHRQHGQQRHGLPVQQSAHGNKLNVPYAQAAFEADLPRIEAADLGGICNRTTGAGCTNPPTTDDGAPANFYPYFSTVNHGGACNWGAGENLPHTINNFGGSSAQYGALYPQPYWIFGGHGAVHTVINNYNSGAFTNPC